MPINVITEKDFTPRTFEEARRHFEKKAPLTHEEFERLTIEQRSKAFRIATLHNAVMVQFVRKALARAMESGQTYAEWRREIVLQFEVEGIPRPALHRLRLAFFQNTGRAYSDARREVLDEPEITEAFPYRQYITVGDGTPGVRNVRASHAALHHKVFRWDDPFWDTFTPPWDYGCRCTFAALTAGQAAGTTIWTYRGGAVRPARQQGPGGRQQATRTAGVLGNRQQGERPFKLKANPNYSIEGGELNLDGLDADLRQAIEERMR